MTIKKILGQIFRISIHPKNNMKVGIKKEIWEDMYSLYEAILGDEDHVIEVDKKFFEEYEALREKFLLMQYSIQEIVKKIPKKK